jgi:hypothetical protein
MIEINHETSTIRRYPVELINRNIYSYHEIVEKISDITYRVRRGQNKKRVEPIQVECPKPFLNEKAIKQHKFT